MDAARKLQKERFSKLETYDRSYLTAKDNKRYAERTACFRCINTPDMNTELQYFETMLKPTPICKVCRKINKKRRRQKDYHEACKCHCHSYKCNFRQKIQIRVGTQIVTQTKVRELKNAIVCDCWQSAAHTEQKNQKDTIACENCKLLICSDCVTKCGSCAANLCAKPTCMRKPIFACECQLTACVMCLNICGSYFFASVPMCPGCDQRCPSCGDWACKKCLTNNCEACAQVMCNTYRCFGEHFCAKDLDPSVSHDVGT